MLIESDEQYEDAVALLAGAEVVAVDTESTGLHMHQEDVIRGISVAFRRGTGNIYSFYVPLSHPNSQNFEPRQLLAALKAVPLHIFHHAIFDWGALAQVGYERNRNFYDTQVGNWLLDENLPTGLKPTAARLWGENEAEEQAHLKALMKPPALSLLADELWSVALLGGVRLTKKRALEMARESQEILHVPKTWATFTAEDIGVYAAKDTELTLRLYDYQLSRTSEVARPDVIYRPAMERELAFQWVLYGMIAAGVRVDVDKMRGQRVAAEARKEEIEAAIGSEVVDIGGQETAVNLRSSRHLAALVYDNWGLECFEHTGSGARSVARSALEPHETHEGVAAILEHKRLAKALSAFYEPLSERVGPGGRVRGHFSSTRTVTGRLASSDPNLQTIPRETTIAGIRECFVPAEGKELWGFDLDQAELRVMSAISKETAMSEPILAGRSIHSETAASVFGDDFSAEQRVLAKGLNFGFCVGLGTRVLTDDFRWVPAETLQEGDGLLAFDEHGPRQWRHGEVTATAIRELPGREIELEDGTVLFATLDHKWLVSGKYGGPRWCTTRHLRPTLTKFLRYLTPWEPDLSYDGGWLAGMFDGEGSLGRGGPANRQCGLSLSQKDGPIARRVIDLLEQRGFDVAVYDREDSVLRIHVKGGFPEAVRAMGTLRPQRLMDKVYTRDLPRLQARTGTQRVGIRRAGPVEVRPVVVLTTSTATFFAEGFGAHNCYGIQAKKFAASLAAGPPRVPVTMCDHWRCLDWQERRETPRCRECLVCRADAILKGYERTYPRLVSMMNYLKDRAKDRGYIPLHIKGRWRHFRSPGNRYPRYYSAMNGVVQGGIAEVMKSVMLRLGEVPDATLCLQVHDELVMEVAPGEADRVQEQLSGILREVNPFSVELVFTKKQWGV